MNAYKTAMDQAAALVDQIDAQQALINEMVRYQDGEPQGGIQPQQHTEDVLQLGAGIMGRRLTGFAQAVIASPV